MDIFYINEYIHQDTLGRIQAQKSNRRNREIYKKEETKKEKETHGETTTRARLSILIQRILFVSFPKFSSLHLWLIFTSLTFSHGLPLNHEFDEYICPTHHTSYSKKERKKENSYITHVRMTK